MMKVAKEFYWSKANPLAAILQGRASPLLDLNFQPLQNSQSSNTKAQKANPYNLRRIPSPENLSPAII
jgi:hypothetical protein